MPPPQTRRFERLRRWIAHTLETYQRRPLNTAQHTPWEVMHGFVAFGIPTQVRVGGPAGDPVSAIGWSNMGGRCRGQTMLTTSGDRLVALKGYFGVQGHSAQYLAILAQCRVAASSPIKVNGKQFTVADLIEEEKLACRPGTELTFALIALAHYLPTDATSKLETCPSPTPGISRPATAVKAELRQRASSSLSSPPCPAPGARPEKTQ